MSITRRGPTSWEVSVTRTIEPGKPTKLCGRRRSLEEADQLEYEFTKLLEAMQLRYSLRAAPLHALNHWGFCLDEKELTCP